MAINPIKIFGAVGNRQACRIIASTSVQSDGREPRWTGNHTAEQRFGQADVITTSASRRPRRLGVSKPTALGSKEAEMRPLPCTTCTTTSPVFTRRRAFAARSERATETHQSRHSLLAPYCRLTAEGCSDSGGTCRRQMLVPRQGNLDTSSRWRSAAARECLPPQSVGEPRGVRRPPRFRRDDRSIPTTSHCLSPTMRRSGPMPHAVEGDHNTRLTLPVRPQRNACNSCKPASIESALSLLRTDVWLALLGPAAQDPLERSLVNRIIARRHRHHAEAASREITRTRPRLAP